MKFYNLKKYASPTAYKLVHASGKKKINNYRFAALLNVQMNASGAKRHLLGNIATNFMLVIDFKLISIDVKRQIDDKSN